MLGTALGPGDRLLPRRGRRRPLAHHRRVPGAAGRDRRPAGDRRARHVEADADPRHRRPLHADHRPHACAPPCSRSASSTTSPRRGCATSARPTCCSARSCPNVMGPVMVEFTVRLGYAIFVIATLTFLGFGIQPPAPDWGLQVFEHYGLISRRLLVDGALPGARHHHPRRRRQPDRRRRREGVRAMSAAAPRRPALELRDLHVEYRIRGIWREVLRGVSLQVADGRVLRARRRVGLRQVDRRLRGRCATCRATGAIASGSVHVGGAATSPAMSDAEVRRLRAERVSMVYQNPGARAEPDAADRRPGGRGLPRSPTRSPKLADQRARGDARQGPDRRPGQRHAPLPAPALGRHAAARGHRHGARQGPVAAHPRRADDRPRRDRRGRGARPRRRAARRVRHERPLHLATTST